MQLPTSICQAIDSSLAQMLTFDVSDIKLYVTENTPKTLNFLIRFLESHCKDNLDGTPYKSCIFECTIFLLLYITKYNNNYPIYCCNTIFTGEIPHIDILTCNYNFLILFLCTNMIR